MATSNGHTVGVVVLDTDGLFGGDRCHARRGPTDKSIIVRPKKNFPASSSCRSTRPRGHVHPMFEVDINYQNSAASTASPGKSHSLPVGVVDVPTNVQKGPVPHASCGPEAETEQSLQVTTWA